MDFEDELRFAMGLVESHAPDTSREWEMSPWRWVRDLDEMDAVRIGTTMLRLVACLRGIALQPGPDGLWCMRGDHRIWGVLCPREGGGWFHLNGGIPGAGPADLVAVICVHPDRVWIWLARASYWQGDHAWQDAPEELHEGHHFDEGAFEALADLGA